jgi:hypothetical protein
MAFSDTKDPVRDAFLRMSRILERLPTDDDRRRVVKAFAVLLDMPKPEG